MIIKNKQGDKILDLDPNSWEYTYWSMLITSQMAGIPTISEKRCAQLLTWLLVYGGNFEATTQNRKLFLDITFAQYTLNIYGEKCLKTP